MKTLARLFLAIPDPMRSMLIRNPLAWRIRDWLNRPCDVDAAPPLDGFHIRVPRSEWFMWGAEPPEPYVLQFIDRVVRAGDCVVDVGAFIGYTSLYLARVVGPSGHVHAFEPVPENYRLLSHNLAANGLANVTANPFALGATSGQAAFYRPRGQYGPHGSLLGGDSTRYAATTVTLASLDDYMSQLGWPRPSFVKIDVEGAEVDVIEGMRQTISRHAPALFVDIHDQPPFAPEVRERVRRVMPVLAQLGYMLYSLHDDPELKRPLLTAKQWVGRTECAALYAPS